MNADFNVLRRAHQKIEEVINRLAEGGSEFCEGTHESEVKLLEEVEQLLWSQLEDSACVELLKQVPEDVLKKLSGFRPEVLQATARRMTLKGEQW